MDLVLKKNNRALKYIPQFINAIASTDLHERDQLYFEFRQSKIPLYPIFGNTSRKKFYKFSFQEADYIIIKFPEDSPASEEFFVDFDGRDLNQIKIFINVSEFLAKFLPFIPVIYGYSIQHNFLIMPYLGRENLFAFMRRTFSKREFDSIFQKLIEWLVLLQKISCGKRENHICFQRRLERRAIFLEFQEFIEFGVLKGRKERSEESEIQELIAYLKEFSEKIAAAPIKLIHRDYQSKNILLYQHNPWILDYQDACLGPFTYDLASLIYDRKIDLDYQTQTELSQKFWEKAYSEDPICSYSEFTRYLKFAAIHRMCKSIGRRSKTAFLKGQRPDFVKDLKPALDCLSSLWLSLKLDHHIHKIITQKLCNYMNGSIL